MTRRNPLAEHDLAAQLASEIRALIGKLRRRLREQSNPGDFTPSQVAVLVRLDREGPGTVTSLARAEGMRPQSMGAVIAQLDAAGLLNGAPDPDDGRQTLWSLTDACAAWLRDVRAARQDWLSHTIEAKLDEDEQRELAAALDLLQRLVDD
ncbi:MarR family transcriptional regulator [Paraburkholderia sp.]|uniref:MarR family winged helix-turn-helix transcriptional regulator n=1 Tax=Paraburkholderia sp. TaxID=1926495 RepID=UPI0025F829C6|nr:MarR family transcriptional regulator [Paraburkholderia sp.]